MIQIGKRTFKFRPYDWQMKAIEECERRNYYALFADMGTGKTCCAINILRDKYFKSKKLLNTLIVSPVATLYNWKDEVLKSSWIKENDIVLLANGTGAKKTKQFEDAVIDRVTNKLVHPKIVIVNYETLVASSSLMSAIIEWGPTCLVLDEAHYIKNPSAQRSKKMFALAQLAKYRFVLTGTPILNSVADIFQVYKILDLGLTFGKNYHVFKNKYMKDENIFMRGKTQKYFPKWVTNADTIDELQEKIYRNAVRVMKSECLDLPPLIKKTIYVDLSPEQAKYYKEMKRDFICFVKEKMKNKEIHGAVVAQLAVTKALRLMQIVTGYLPLDSGEEIEIAKNPRLEKVKELLEELSGQHKIILWCSFKKNYEQLSRICNELKLKHVFITGEQNAKEKQNSIVEFDKDPDTRVVIANRRAGGLGINLIRASYAINYSRNFSLGEEEQSEARNYRGGSEIHEQIIKIDLCAKGTIDEDCLEALRGKKDLSVKIIDLVNKMEEK